MKTKKRRILTFRKNRKTGKPYPITAPLVKSKKKIAAGKRFRGVKPKQIIQGKTDSDIREWIVTWGSHGEKKQTKPMTLTTQKELNSFLRKLKANGIKKFTVTPVHAGTAVEESKGGWIVEYFIKNREKVRGKFKVKMIKKQFTFTSEKKAKIFKKKMERVRGHYAVTARPEKPQTVTSQKEYQDAVRKENLQVVNALEDKPSSWQLELRDIIRRDSPKFKREMRVDQEFIRLGFTSLNPTEPITVKEIRDQLRQEKKAGNTTILSALEKLILEKKAIRSNEPSLLP